MVGAVPGAALAAAAIVGEGHGFAPVT